MQIVKKSFTATFAAMPFGGGGALHTGALIKEVGLGSALVPRFPGVTSALGCVVADMRHDRVQTVNRPLAEIDAPALGREMIAVAEQTEVLLAGAGVDFAGVDRVFELDMLYLGQTHTVSVAFDIPAGGLTAGVIHAAFEEAYRGAYGRLLDGIAMRIMNYRVAVVGRRPKLDMAVFAPSDGKPAEACRIGTRQVYVDGRYHEASVFERLDLAVGSVLEGPALLEQPDTTIFVDPGLQALVDTFGNLVIKASES